MIKILKRVAIGLVVIVIVLIALVYVVSTIRWNRDYQNFDIEVSPITIPTDEESIARGQRIAFTHYCATCHGANLSGDYLMNMPLLAVVAAPNLTSGAGGVGAENTDEDWIRAIRHGVGNDGRGLIGMPARFWNQMNDDDLGALIAYLETLPPVDNELPERQIGPLFRVALALGHAPQSEAAIINHDAPRPSSLEPDATVEYGEYLSYMCMPCHGETFNGGKVRNEEGDFSIALNLTPGGNLQNWTEEEFISALRTGTTPDGRHLEFMPWQYVGQLSDEQLQALWLYLQTVPALEQNLERTDI